MGRLGVTGGTGGRSGEGRCPMKERLLKNRFIRFGYLMARRFLRHGVGTQSAALSFYLLFMIFPFLIFLSALLGLLHLDVAGILVALGEILPGEVVELVGMYLRYVRENSSLRLALFGLFFSIWFPMRATNALLRAVRTAYHLGPPHSTVRQLIKSLAYTVLLIVTITLTLTAVTVSDWLLDYAVAHFRLPAFVALLWGKLRFPVAGVAGFFALCALYALAQDGPQRWRNIWPGTVSALGAWLGLSWFYNLYVEHFAHYSVLYGSIGTIIVLLIWLNMSAVTLIMGAEMNGVLMAMGSGKEREELL